MQILCKQCRLPIAAENVNIQSGIAKCSACNAVFFFMDDLSHAQKMDSLAKAPSSFIKREPEQSASLREERMGKLLAIPDSFTLEDNGMELRFSRRWFQFAHIFVLLFSLVWNSFLVFWYSISLRMSNIPWIFQVFPLGHVAVGLGLFYYALCGLLNRTQILVTPQLLRIRHIPLFWFGNRRISRDELQQLFVMQVKTKSRGEKIYQFTLFALLADGKRVTLVKNLPYAADGIFLEKKIEERMGIINRQVEGAAKS